MTVMQDRELNTPRPPWLALGLIAFALLLSACSSSGDATEFVPADSIEQAPPVVDESGAVLPDETESDEVEPDEVEPDEVEPDVEPDEVEPDDAEPDDAEPDDAEPDDAEPDEVEPDDAEPDDAEPDEQAAPGDLVAVDEVALSGTRWIFVTGVGPEGEILDTRTIDPEATISLNFFVGELAGQAVCNRYAGAADIGPDAGVVSLADIATAEEDCGDDLDAIIDTYISTLAEMTEGNFSSDGLVLNGNGFELLFEPAAVN